MNQEFAENIKNHIREYLPADYQDAKITLEKVTKGNDRTLTGLIIRKDDETVAPSIYLEHYEEQFGKGRPMDDIMKEIAQIKMENSLELPIDVRGLEDYETARPLLAVRLCDPEKNQEYLKDKPHTACGELAATYRIQIMEDSSGTASAVVTNDMLNLWGITPEQLHHDTVAAENARNPVCLYTMDDVMSEIMLSVKPENLFEQTEPLESEMMPMYILTNHNKVNGAGVLARDGVLDKIGELLGSDFYVLPSSTHEVILVPDNGNMQTKELEDTVKEINATQVAPEDFTDELYRRVAGILYEQYEKGEGNPAAIVGMFHDDEEQQRRVTEIFHAALPGPEEPGEREKALRDVISRVKRDSLEAKRTRLDVTNLADMQRFIDAVSGK